MTQNSHGSTLTTSAVTALVAFLPDGAMTYIEKLASVLLLAAVAEVGRRVIALIWKEKP